MRYNDASTSLPEVHLAPGYFVGARVLPAVKNQPHWKNLDPRVGAAYDLFGTARRRSRRRSGATTRCCARRRRTRRRPGGASNNRTWNDTERQLHAGLRSAGSRRQRRMRRDGRTSNSGRTSIPTRNAADAMDGFNRQDYNWQASASVQHELRPGIGVNVGYFRTWYGGFLTNRWDNHGDVRQNADRAGRFRRYCFTAPVDSRLPHSGEQLCGLYDVSRRSSGRSTTWSHSSRNVGDHTRVYNGVDATMSARFGGGAQVSGGVSIGRTVDNNCVVVDSPQDARRNSARRSRHGRRAAGEVPGCLPAAVGPADERHLPEPRRVENTPTNTLTNAQIAPSLGRNLAQCGAAATCMATVTVPLEPPGSM